MFPVHCSLALIQICVTIIYIGQRVRKGGSCHYPFWILFVVCTTCLLQITCAKYFGLDKKNFRVTLKVFIIHLVLLKH